MPRSVDFYAPFQKAVTEALRELLSEKHLYQSVRVDVSFIDRLAKAQHSRQPSNPIGGYRIGPSPSWEAYRKDGLALMSRLWIPDTGIEYPENSWQAVSKSGHIENSVDIRPPTIETFCPKCGKCLPYNPMETGRSKWEQGRTSHQEQWFHLSYECQGCKGEPVRFLVRRSKEKLTLAGRDPMETVEVPTVIPKTQAKRFSSAAVAFQSGQTLAAIFLLRVFVEQYWRGIAAVKDALKGVVRPSGDKIGEAYKGTLPPDFKDRFPTLCEVYSDLSAAIHSADEKEEIFTRAQEQVVEHFEARRLFRLDEKKASTEPDT